MPANGGGSGTNETRTTLPKGGDLPHNNMQPTQFLNVMIKL